MGLVPEPRFLSRGIDLAATVQNAAGGSTDGFYPELHNLITGNGWISLGPGYRHHLFAGRALVDGSAALSWHAYKMAQGRFELPALPGRVAVGAFGRWQDYTQINYFGVGADTPESGRSEYRLRTTDMAGYASVRPARWLSIDGEFGRQTRPKLSAPTGPFDRNFPDTLVSFPQDPGVRDPAEYLHGDLAVTADNRDHADHPSTGALYRAAAAQYSDRRTGQFSFRRYEAEGLQLIPLVGRKWVIALHAWGVFSDTGSSHEVPFYLLPSLGGQNTLRGYHDFRFHDRHMLLTNIESRWALFRSIDIAAFADAGNVAPRFGDLNLDKRSYGLGVRAHTRGATLVGLDAAHSVEGWRVMAKLGDPFALSRLLRKGGDLPIVP
jgi:hypothetical protein